MAEPTPELTRAWRRALTQSRSELSGPAIELWIDEVAPLSYRNGVVQIGVPNPFVKEMLTQRYHTALRQALSEAIGEPLEIEFEVVQQRPAVPGPADPPEADRPKPDDLFRDGPGVDFTSSPLNPRFTFETFVVGPSNRFPHAASQAVAKSPAASYNPLFLYGGVGLGKTHLMQAIGHQLRQDNPSLNVAYVTGETFLYHFVTSIREDRTAEFRQRYRSVDVWLVDDFQFVAARERSRTEAEFFHTFNALYETGRQIVITSDRPPKELMIDDRLRSRFEWGLVTDIKPPDIETRLAILQKRAGEDALSVPDDVLMYIARVVRESIRVLEGALIKVVASASLLHEEVTLELARDSLKDYSVGEGQLDITTESIQRAVARHYGFEPAALTGKSRRAEVVRARQVAMYLCREIVRNSYAEIGLQFQRDHSTVMHACGKIADLLEEEEADVVAAVNSITERIELYGPD